MKKYKIVFNSYWFFTNMKIFSRMYFVHNLFTLVIRISFGGTPMMLRYYIGFYILTEKLSHLMLDSNPSLWIVTDTFYLITFERVLYIVPVNPKTLQNVSSQKSLSFVASVITVATQQCASNSWIGFLRPSPAHQVTAGASWINTTTNTSPWRRQVS